MCIRDSTKGALYQLSYISTSWSGQRESNPHHQLGRQMCIRDRLCGVVQGTQNDGRRQFTATVDTYEQVVLRIEFEVQLPVKKKSNLPPKGEQDTEKR